MNGLRIINCFRIADRGLLTEIQHFMNGIPSGSVLFEPITKECWEVKTRVLLGSLLITDSEKYFDCETEYEVMSNSFKSEEARNNEITSEIEKRENGIYWYFLVSSNRKREIKPAIGSVLELKVNT